jgi:hypothetical protein
MAPTPPRPPRPSPKPPKPKAEQYRLREKVYANSYHFGRLIVLPRVNGQRGEVVTYISEVDAYGTVLVERADGHRFPIQKYKLASL